MYYVRMSGQYSVMNRQWVRTDSSYIMLSRLRSDLMMEMQTCKSALSGKYLNKLDKSHVSVILPAALPLKKGTDYSVAVLPWMTSSTTIFVKQRNIWYLLLVFAYIQSLCILYKHIGTPIGDERSMISVLIVKNNKNGINSGAQSQDSRTEPVPKKKSSKLVIHSAKL